MERNLKDALNSNKEIPELRISKPENKNSFILFPRFNATGFSGFEFKLTIWLDSIKSLFRKRKCTDLDNNQYNVVDKK